jgi:cation transport ATPase
VIFLFQILIWNKNSKLNNFINSLQQQNCRRVNAMTAEQETQEDMQNEGEIYQENTQPEQEVEQANYVVVEEHVEQTKSNSLKTNSQEGDRGNFVHGLAVGFGISCIATFAIVWISLFFTPKLQNTVTYENLLSIFVYPLIYLLSVGLIALTAGIVKEYYSAKNKS